MSVFPALASSYSCLSRFACSPVERARGFLGNTPPSLSAPRFLDAAPPPAAVLLPLPLPTAVLLPSALLLPQLYLFVWQRSFYPEFRDLAMEAEYHNLECAHLKRWRIPQMQRRLPLRKGAPHAPEIGRKGLWANLPGRSFWSITTG